MAITPYIPYVTNFSPTSHFRLLIEWLLTFDFQLPTSDFSLFTTFHFPVQNGLVSCCSSAGIDFLGNRANHDANLTYPAIEIYWTSGESSAYQILPCAASQKQLPLLKESGQQLSFLGHVLRLPDYKPVREFLMYRFQLRRGGNPEDSEPCSPVVYLLSSGVSWYPVKWQSAVGNGSRPPTMEEKLVVDCSSANGWWWWTSKQKLQGWQATRSLLALNGLKTLLHIALTRISLWKMLLFKLQFYQPSWFGAFGVQDTNIEDDELKVYLKWTLHVLIYCTQLHTLNGHFCCSVTCTFARSFSEHPNS